MSLGDSLSLFGLIMALVGIVIATIWPNEKRIGWVCLCVAVLLLVFFAVVETRDFLKVPNKTVTPAISAGASPKVLNKNPTKPQVHSEAPVHKRSAAITKRAESSISVPRPQPSTVPVAPQTTAEYFGSVPHLDLPRSNGIVSVVSQIPETSTRADAPYEIQVVIQTSVVWSTLKLAIECNGDLVGGSATMSSGGATMMSLSSLAKGHPNIFIYEYGSAIPPFGPADPLEINLWSEKAVSCSEVTTF